jgi:pimeloyl-ACP methyl ester carboxylesterase
LGVAVGQKDESMSGLDLGDPRRPVDLVFVHANGFNAATYRFLLEPLAGKARILAADLRGHGRSGLPADPAWRRNWHDFRDDLVALIDAVDGPPVVLAGHSMGAVVALLAAERRQHRVRSVVMFDPVILPRPASLMMSWPLAGRMARRYPLVAGALRRRARFDSRDAAIEAYRGRGAFRDWPEQALADYVAEGFRDVGDGVELVCAPEWEASNYAAQGHDPWPVLRRMERPVHILKAERGSTCSLGPGQIPDVTVDTVPEGTHFFPMIQPEAARAALRRSLSAADQG